MAERLGSDCMPRINGRGLFFADLARIGYPSRPWKRVAQHSPLLGSRPKPKTACTGLSFGGRDVFPSHFLPGLQRAHDGGRGAQAERFMRSPMYSLWLPHLRLDFA